MGQLPGCLPTPSGAALAMDSPVHCGLRSFFFSKSDKFSETSHTNVREAHVFYVRIRGLPPRNLTPSLPSTVRPNPTRWSTMPTTGDVNAALAAYQSATDTTRSEHEKQLIKELEHYAKRIVWLTLHQERPEIVNEGVQYILSNIHDFRGDSKFRTYVYTLIQRYCFREMQLKIDRKETSLTDLRAEMEASLASYELDGDARMTLDKIRKNLSDDEKELIDRKLEGYKTAEIAQLSSTSTSTIEGRWRRLCAKVRQNEAKRTKTYRNNPRLNRQR
jgi:RNA polymerase sigma factor (sigma-70 family)